jgi:hypothetical protein
MEESRRYDTACLADLEEIVPVSAGGDNLAAVGGKETRLKIEGSKEVTRGTRE